MGQRATLALRNRAPRQPMPCERCLSLTLAICRSCRLVGTPLCDACQRMHPACGRCMRRIQLAHAPQLGEQGVRLFIGDDVAARASPPPWLLQTPLARGSALPTPTAPTYLGLALRAPPGRPARPLNVGGTTNATGGARVSSQTLAIVSRGTPSALAIVAVRRAVTTTRRAWMRAKVRGLARLVHLARLIPHAQIATATREARLRNGSLRAAFALDRLLLCRLGHQPCEWCGVPTARRCATCETGHRGVICMDCAFVFLGCTVCWLRHRGQAPPPADADALAGWYPR